MHNVWNFFFVFKGDSIIHILSLEVCALSEVTEFLYFPTFVLFHLVFRGMGRSVVGWRFWGGGNICCPFLQPIALTRQLGIWIVRYKSGQKAFFLLSRKTRIEKKTKSFRGFHACPQLFCLRYHSVWLCVLLESFKVVEWYRKWGDGIFRGVSCVPATCQKALPPLPAHNTTQHNTSYNTHAHNITQHTT